jgi:small acid-soluble spore protein F (minor alpha/beta-type SASP)
MNAPAAPPAAAIAIITALARLPRGPPLQKAGVIAMNAPTTPPAAAIAIITALARLPRGPLLQERASPRSHAPAAAAAVALGARHTADSSTRCARRTPLPPPHTSHRRGTPYPRRDAPMASNRSLLSDASMHRIAERLGVSDVVEREGWGGVSSRDCGGVVAVAVRIAEEALAGGQRYGTGAGQAEPRFTGGAARGWTGPRP